MEKLVAIAVCAGLVAACDGFHLVAERPDAGEPDAALPDGPPPPPPVVQVTAPNGGETLYPAEPFTVSWIRTDTDASAATYDVALVDGDGAMRAIATGTTETSVEWTPSGVAAPTDFTIVVTATNAGGTSSDASDATFTLAPPLTGTSFARDVQPIFSAGCLTQFCHTTTSKTAQLDLSPGASYGRLVGVASVENPCTTYKRVQPGLPDQSYLVFKVVGSGACFYGVRMPKNAPALSSAEITTIRTWITEGARDN